MFTVFIFLKPGLSPSEKEFPIPYLTSPPFDSTLACNFFCVEHRERERHVHSVGIETETEINKRKKKDPKLKFQNEKK